MKLGKILSFLTYGMIGITVILVAMFYLGGNVEGEAYPTPVNTDLLLVWGMILFGIATLLAVVFPILQIITNPKGAGKGLMGLLALVVVVLISYALSDGTLLDLPGYTGPDNNPTSLKFADTVLYTMYILGVGAILSIVGTEILRRFR